jgi:hypothetical protein
MPYRRLPNTDSARLRAMQKALQKSEGLPPFKLPYTVSTFQELKNFYPEFKQALDYQKDSFERQVAKNKHLQDSQKKAKLYISHFIQVLNFAIIRGELKPETRSLFGMDEDEKKLPQLNTEKEIIEWGEKIITAEQKRLAAGNAPITNPTIARVKVHYEDFLRSHLSQKNLQETQSKGSGKMIQLRSKADEIITRLWNEIEESYSDLTAEEKRESAEKYGLIYVFRKHEKLSFSNLKLNLV